MKNQTVIVLDFGGQYKELIARRVRECGVYSVILPGNCSLDRIKELEPIGIITTGGPMSVYKPDSPHCSKELFELGIPILGICYGFQLMSYTLGGTVEGCSVSEYGRTEMVCDTKSDFFKGFDEKQTVLMSHTDRVSVVPDGFVTTAHTADCPIAAMENKEKKLFGIQFHPEVLHTDNGVKMIRRFLYTACGAKGDYSMDDYIERQVKEIREKVGNDKVLLALSGGVDSSVCAALLSKAIPNQLVCVFVDHGFMRKNEGDEIEAIFSKRDLQFIRVNAEDRYLAKLKGVSDPETKRKIIGNEFIEVFQDEAKKLDGIKYLAQGTIYPDVIESGTDKASTIKSHHNVGGLPDTMDFDGIIEPLRGLFKDEVRRVGRQLGLPRFLVERQPFPGPGLAIRVMGDLTKEKLEILRNADAIFREEVDKLRKRPNQYFAVLTDTHSVGVMGDERTYDYVLALRAVITDDFMTCEYAPLSHKLLSRVSTRITNEVKGINRVTYDITAKPPATVEWE
ncbi:MAG TPA: GMP synthase (glutamine-hydrolyzing) [Ruminococcaceae bacterium]|nr:GMP synthase (glutamine-hydrolyzing) [Oscillospiraceae bacterium]